MKKFIKWQCKICKNIITSNKEIRWSMDTCKCGETSVDAEEYYTRFIGNEPLIIKET